MELADVDLTDSDTWATEPPWAQMDLLRGTEPVYAHPDGQGTFWAVTSHSLCTEVNRDHERFSSEAGGVMIETPPAEQLMWLNQMMLYMDPPGHTKLRLLVNKGFTPRMVGRLHDHVRDLTRRIVDDVIERGECDFVVDVAAELPLQVIAEMMGVPFEDRLKMFDWSNRMVGSEDPEYVVSEDEAMDASAEMFTYAQWLAEQKRADPGDDIISALLQAEVDGHRLSDEDFNLFFMLLAVAGNETTRNLTAHGMHALLERPHLWRRLRERPELLDAAVEEMLRWGTPVIYFRRTARVDTTLGGVAIAEGDRIAMYLLAANRDPDVFDDPYEFDVGRDPNPHIAFGAGGPHFCLGANLARMEIKVLFEELLGRIPEVEQTGPVERLRSHFIHGIKHLPVAFEPGARVEAA